MKINLKCYSGLLRMRDLFCVFFLTTLLSVAPLLSNLMDYLLCLSFFGVEQGYSTKT